MNAAVVGMGGMGRRHVQALQQLEAKLVAVCDQRAESLKDISPSTRTYGRWQELIKEEHRNLDLLCVVTNGPSHAEIVVEAAEAGIKHILCEKPMATSGQATRRMVQVCEEKGSLLAVNMSRRYMDRYRKLREMLQSGVIGDVRHISVVVGAGGLGCIGTIYFDSIAWLTGATPVWVIGEVETNPLPNVRGEQFHDPGGRGIVSYDTGMNVAAEFSEDIRVHSFMHIRGTEGHINLDSTSAFEWGRAAMWTRPIDQWSTPKTRSVNPTSVELDLGPPLDSVEETRRGLQDLLNGRTERTDLSGISSVDTALAFHLSGMRGMSRVELPLRGEDLSFDVPIT